MPPLKITTPEFGGISYLSWLRTPSNLQPVELLAEFIQPVQEQFHFQERWFYFDGLLAIPQNDRLVWTVQCPEGESWLFDYILVKHDFDPGPRIFEIDLVNAGEAGPTGNGIIVREDIPKDFIMVLHPNTPQDFTNTDDFNMSLDGPLILLPREQLIITSGINTEVANMTVEVSARFRERPVPTQAPRISDTVPTFEAL